MKSSPSVASRQRRKATLKKTKGMQSARRKSYRLGKQAVVRSLEYSYRDRRNRKREFRQLWNKRINAACRENGTTYSVFINSLKSADTGVDRKVLAHIAAEEPAVFAEIVKRTVSSK